MHWELSDSRKSALLSASWLQGMQGSAALCAEPKQGQSALYEMQVNSSGGYLLTLASSAGGDADLYCLPGGSLYNAYGPPSATEYAWSSGALASTPRLR